MPANNHLSRMPLQVAFQSDLFGERLLPGLRFQNDFLSKDEEENLIWQIDGEDLSPFRFQRWTGKRLTRTFGWRYDYENGSFGKADPIPEFLNPVRERAAEFAGIDPMELEQALLIHYDVGAGIGWHLDRPVFEHVIGISLGSPAPMRFRKKIEKGFARGSVPLPPRSIYLLSGEARHDWEHSIDRLTAPRWSITFRTLSAKGRAKARANTRPKSCGT
jgi:alkylated DNA repair dioxygenase AlkB